MSTPSVEVIAPTRGEAVTIAHAIVKWNGYGMWCGSTWNPRRQYWLTKIYSNDELEGPLCPHPMHWPISKESG